MKQILFTFLLGFLLLSGTTKAQNRQLSGKVTSAEDGSALAGVSVVVQGTTTATQTNSLGNYTINVPESGILVFTYLGYDRQSIVINKQTVLNVQLMSDAATLDEVVVTALGIKKDKKSVGYAVQDVKADEILSSREPNIVNALAGKIAGVHINSSGGQAGSSSAISIRGNSSLLGNNEPLFVIDGIPMDNSTNQGVGSAVESTLLTGTNGNRGMDLDPNIIENISVLKGAAASALYGSRGANGVIMITTKKGFSDAERKLPRISYSSSVTLDNAFTDGYQTSYLLGLDGLYRNGLSLANGGYSEENNAVPVTSAVWGPHRDNISQAVIDSIGMPKLLDPRKEFYQTGVLWNNSISLSGGSAGSSYVLTYTNTDQKGIVPNNTFKRNSFTAGFSSKLSQNVSSSTSINYTNSKNNRMLEGNGTNSFLYSLNFAPVNFDMWENYQEHGNITWQSDEDNTTGFNNPFWLVNNNSRPSAVNRFVVSNETSWDILPWLKLTNRVGLDTYVDKMDEHINIGTKGLMRGRMYSGLVNYSQWNNDLILSGNHDINEDWKVSGLIGTNYNQREYARRTVRGLNLDLPGFYDITATESQQAYQSDSKRALVGLYASATVDYKDYLYLNLTARNDWSSTLPKGNNSFFYPSVSLSYVFSDALKLQNEFFSYGKLRASIAQAGNDADPYLTTQTYSKANPSDGTRGEILFPYDGVNGFLLSSSLASNTLTPEMVTEYEFGTDFRFFRNRLGLELSYYNKSSKKQIIQQPIASSSGFSSRVANAGEIINSGLEIVLTGSPIKTKDFDWNMLVNFSNNKFKLKTIAEGVPNIFLGGFTAPQIRIDEQYGYVIWGLGYQRNDNGDILIDDDGYPIVSGDAGPLGNVLPKWNAGIRNTLKYKNLSLSGLIDIRHGGKILNFDLYYSTFYGTSKLSEDRGSAMVWEGIRESDGQPNTTEIIKDQDYYRDKFGLADEDLVEDSGFIKLREITLNYALPKAWLAKSKIQDLSLSVTGRNLWIKSNFSYKDPEGSILGNGVQGFYHSVTPGSKGVTFGVNFKF